MLNVVVTCTKEKRFAVCSDCELRSVCDDKLADRVRSWRGRLVSCRQRIPARELYGGDHWAVAREISSRRFNVQTYVCSAGYGLIHIDDPISPYSATFSRRHPDTVWQNSGREDISAADWWAKICGWKGHRGFGPRSFVELASENTDTPLLVVASEIYLRAIHRDLVKARESLVCPRLLLVLSAGTRELGELTENLLPCDARMQPEVGGVRRSLNVRLASKIVSEARDVPTLDGLKRKLRRLLAKQPDLPVYNRKPMSDDEVRKFILKGIRRHKKASHTPMLRELRDAGYACEQKRFAGLFREVSESVNG